MNVFSIIVIYNPNISQLKACVASLFPQSEKIIIVKNSKERLDDDFKSEKIVQVQLDKNYGIAYAQNRGIEMAIAGNADFVLFSDQDTVFPVDFVGQSLMCYERHRNEKIAAVVPFFYNENKKQFARISVAKTRTILPENGKEYYVSHAISSGTVCPAAVFETVGMMNERLFIDWVDTEWCWRATDAGYKLVCDTKNIIHHSMGDDFKTVFGRKIVVYSDFRNYFFLRNGIYLLLHSHLLSFSEKLPFCSFMIKKTVLFVITSGFQLKSFKTFYKALKKGLSNKFSLEEELK